MASSTCLSTRNGFPVRTQPVINIHNLFLGGDVRTDEDWIMLSYVVPIALLVLPQLTPATLDKAFTQSFYENITDCETSSWDSIQTLG